jgi:hypothetical protein
MSLHPPHFVIVLIIALVATCLGEPSAPQWRKKVELTRNVTRAVMHNTEVFWRVPASPSTPNGVVMIFHACLRTPGDFFMPEEVTDGQCTTCNGLHQNREIVADIMGKGYVVVVMSATNRETMCFGVEKEGENDLVAMLAVRDHVYATLGLKKDARLVLMGVAAGGYFATYAMVEMQQRGYAVDGIIPMVSTFRSNIIQKRAEFNKMKVSKRPCPTVLIAMFRDPYTANLNNLALRTYTMIERPIVEYVGYVKAIHANFFEKHAGLTLEYSQLVVKMLKKFNLLNEHMELIRDPRKSHWRKSVRWVIKKDMDSLEEGVSDIAQAMNFAWSEQEVTNEYTWRALSWLEAVWANSMGVGDLPGGGISLSKLAQMYPG